MKYDVLIVGAGLAGLISARLFAENGKNVLVLEKRNHIAGNCYDYKSEEGVTIQQYGPHIFHTKDEEVWEFLNKYTKFNDYVHRVESVVDGKYIPFPVCIDTISQLFDIPIEEVDVKEFLANEVKNSTFNEEHQNFRDAVVSQVGERLYDVFIKNYTKKQWGTEPENLSIQLAGRIPVRENRDTRYFTDPYQGIPVNGYTKMIENIGTHPNIKIELNTDYFEVKDEYETDITIYTGEIDRYFDYTLGKLDYRSLEFELKTIDKEQFQPVSQVNYPDESPWTRITEFKHFLDEKTDKTVVAYEYPRSEGMPYYPVPTRANIDRRKLYVAEAEKLEQAGTHLFVGRLAEYRYYNMDQVVKATLTKVKKRIYG